MMELRGSRYTSSAASCGYLPRGHGAGQPLLPGSQPPHAARRLLLLLLLLPVTAVAAHGAALQRGEAEIQGVVAGGHHRVRVEDVRSCRPHLEDDGVARLEVHLLRRQLRRARGPGLDDD